MLTGSLVLLQNENPVNRIIWQIEIALCPKKLVLHLRPGTNANVDPSHRFPCQGNARERPSCNPSSSTLHLLVFHHPTRESIGTGATMKIWYITSHHITSHHSTAQHSISSSPKALPTVPLLTCEKEIQGRRRHRRHRRHPHGTLDRIERDKLVRVECGAGGLRPCASLPHPFTILTC